MSLARHTIVIGGPSAADSEDPVARWLAHVEAGRIGARAPRDPRTAERIAAMEKALGVGAHRRALA